MRAKHTPMVAEGQAYLSLECIELFLLCLQLDDMFCEAAVSSHLQASNILPWCQPGTCQQDTGNSQQAPSCATAEPHKPETATLRKTANPSSNDQAMAAARGIVRACQHMLLPATCLNPTCICRAASSSM